MSEHTIDELFPDDVFPRPIDAAARTAIRLEIGRLLDGRAAPGAKTKEMLDRSIFDPNVRYAIHDQDLALWKESIGVAGGLYAIAPNSISLIGGVVLLLYRYRRKRVRIDVLQALILQKLRARKGDGMTRHELDAEIKPEALPQVENALKSLENCVSTDGKATPFVRRKGDRIWAVDV